MYKLKNIFTNLPIHVYYMLWKFQAIWISRKKVFLLATFMTPKFRLTAPYSEVSTAIYDLFLSELLQYIENMSKKSLNVNDAWFGFYSHF